jgi:hypothetical protein
VPGKRLGYYVSQYDGEIASWTPRSGRVLAALERAPVAGKTAIVLTSDHGESLGEHDYYFDHGEDLFDPCLAIPLIVAMPGAKGGQRSSEFTSTLDLVPTILDAVKVSYPPDLAGTSVLGAVTGGGGPGASGFSPRTTATSAPPSTRASSSWTRRSTTGTPRRPSTIGSVTPARPATSGRASRSLPHRAPRAGPVPGPCEPRMGEDEGSCSGRRASSRPPRRPAKSCAPLGYVDDCP